MNWIWIPNIMHVYVSVGVCQSHCQWYAIASRHHNNHHHNNQHYYHYVHHHHHHNDHVQFHWEELSKIKELRPHNNASNCDNDEDHLYRDHGKSNTRKFLILPEAVLASCFQKQWRFTWWEAFQLIYIKTLEGSQLVLIQDPINMLQFNNDIQLAN